MTSKPEYLSATETVVCQNYTLLPITVIILTFNEEKNLQECLESIRGRVKNIIIVDSFSTDNTVKIARDFTENIYQHTFESHAKQFNWALDNVSFDSDWLMRMDSDEIVTQDLWGELTIKLCDFPKSVTGLYMKRRVYFMNRWIRFGGKYPEWLLRIWRTGLGRYEERWMDEHCVLSGGKTIFLSHDIIENNKNSLHWWIGKHNGYATREAIELLNLKYKLFEGKDSITATLFGKQEQRKRWIKENIYIRVPLFIRPLSYFIYRYCMQFGFLDGKEGLLWHFLQGFWYRFLVDAKIYEIEKKCLSDGVEIKIAIKELYDITI